MDTDGFDDFEAPERLREQINASRKRNRDDAASNLNTYEAQHVEQAQAAWDAGFLHVHVRLIDLRIFAVVAGTGDSYDREIHWTSSIAQIVSIGWRLHTWAVVIDKDNRLAAAPVFERVQVPTG